MNNSIAIYVYIYYTYLTPRRDLNPRHIDYHVDILTVINLDV
jgi:hypothetical protein